MRRRTRAAFLAASALAISLLASCGSAPAEALEFTSYPKVDGAAVLQSLAVSAEVKLTGEERASVAAASNFSLSDEAYAKLAKGTVDVVLAAVPSEDSLSIARSRGVEFEMTPIALDALVFYVNKANTVKSLKPDDIRDIYLGKKTSWNEVGGPNIEITAFSQPSGSEIYKVMSEQVMDGLEVASPPTVQRLTANDPEDGDPLNLNAASLGDAVDIPLPFDGSEGALGYGGYYIVSPSAAIYDTAILAVDGITPDAGTITSGKYPYTTKYYAVILKSSPAGSDARKLVTWLSGADGQALVKEAGYVPVS